MLALQVENAPLRHRDKPCVEGIPQKVRDSRDVHFTRGIARKIREIFQISFDLTNRAKTSRLYPLKAVLDDGGPLPRTEEHTSELQSLMRISYAVFCSKTKHLLLQ